MTSMGQLTSLNQSAQLVFIEGVSGLLRCVALGGSPPPEVEVYLDQKDITNKMTMLRTPSLSLQRGMRLMYYTTERRTEHFLLRPEDDGRTVRCVVSVPGSPSNTTFTRIAVHCTTIISYYLLTVIVAFSDQRPEVE